MAHSTLIGGWAFAKFSPFSAAYFYFQSTKQRILSINNFFLGGSAHLRLSTLKVGGGGRTEAD